MKPAAPPAILFLHALPLDGAMWHGQFDLFPARTYAPTLYQYGCSIEDWALAALGQVHEEKLIIIGCSIGGSCALEIANRVPERVKCLVLVGTKAHRNPEPAFLEKAVDLIHGRGPGAAWDAYWAPLFSKSCDAMVLKNARDDFSKRTADELADGTIAFHTRPSRYELLRSFTGETVFVSGSDDIAPGPQTTRKQSQDALKGSYHEVPNCGHYVPLEAPRTFNAILQGELSGHFSG